MCISQPIKHNDPADYGLETLQSDNMRLKYLNSRVSEARNRVKLWKLHYLSPNTEERHRWFINWQLADAQDELNKATKQHSFFKEYMKERQEEINTGVPAKTIMFDLTRIKETPINTITEILPSGFFMHNPFRKEASPSNSLFWNKRKNYWVDYGSGESGSVIDLVMKMQNVSFYQACKILSNIS
jgi:hypothetical protein